MKTMEKDLEMLIEIEKKQKNFKLKCEDINCQECPLEPFQRCWMKNIDNTTLYYGVISVLDNIDIIYGVETRCKIEADIWTKLIKLERKYKNNFEGLKDEEPK